MTQNQKQSLAIPQIIIAQGNKSDNNSSSKSKNNTPFFKFQTTLQYDDSYVSFSIYAAHSVIVSKNGKAHALGDNSLNQILGKLPPIVDKWTEIIIKYNQIERLPFISAVCGQNFTLYLSEHDDHHILSYVCEKNKGAPLFLNTDDRTILGIYGGRYNAAAIDESGCIIIIDSSKIDKNNKTPIILSLPNNEKAVQVACLHNEFFALSSKGAIFHASLQSGSDLHVFEAINFSNRNFVQISGTWEHFLAIDSDGKTYGYGKNHFGHLGIEKFRNDVKKLMEIPTLKSNNLKIVSAGAFHSLFLQTNGTVLGSGKNADDILRIEKTFKNKCVLTPQQSVINNVSYCLAGLKLSVFFVNCPILPKSPNQKIDFVPVSSASSTPHYSNMNKRDLMLELQSLVGKFQFQFKSHKEKIDKIERMSKQLSKELNECDIKIREVLKNLPIVEDDLLSDDNNEIDADLHNMKTELSQRNDKKLENDGSEQKKSKHIKKNNKKETKIQNDSGLSKGSDGLRNNKSKRKEKSNELIRIKKNQDNKNKKETSTYDIEYDVDLDEPKPIKSEEIEFEYDDDSDGLEIKKAQNNNNNLFEYDEDLDEPKPNKSQKTKIDINNDDNSDGPKIKKAQNKNTNITYDIEYDEDSDEPEPKKSVKIKNNIEYDDDSDGPKIKKENEHENDNDNDIESSENSEENEEVDDDYDNDYDDNDYDDNEDDVFDDDDD